MPFSKVIQFNAHRVCLTANGTRIVLSQVPVPFNRLLNAFLSTFFTLVFARHTIVPRGIEPLSPGSEPGMITNYTTGLYTVDVTRYTGEGELT